MNKFEKINQTHDQKEFADKVNGLTASEISKRFVGWSNLAASGATVDEIKDQVWSLCNLLPFYTVMANSEFKLFRGRTCSDNSYFDNTSEMWFPPAQHVTVQGRANRQGESMLYLAQDGRTAMFELNLQSNQHLTIAEYGLKTGATLNLHHIGLIDNISSDGWLELSKKEPEMWTKLGLNSAGINNTKMIHRLLAEEFLRDVKDGSEDKYTVSIAIAEFLLSYGDADGIMYPSIKSQNDFNIVVKPDSATEKLKIHRTYGLEAICTDTSEIGFRYWDASDSIDKKGNINWRNSSPLPDLDWNSSNTESLQRLSKKPIYKSNVIDPATQV